MDTTQYFYRNVIFSKQGNTVSLVDIYNPDNEPKVLDSWLGLVLQLADGQHTLDELFENLSNKYKGNPPANLNKTIDSVVDRMIEAKFIVLSKGITDLPYYLSCPVEQMDIQKAKNLLEQDRPDLN